MNFTTAPSMPVEIASTVLSTEAPHEQFIPPFLRDFGVVCLIASRLIAWITSAQLLNARTK